MLVYHEREFRQVGYWILDVYLCNCSRVYAFPGWYKELQAPQDIWKPINTVLVASFRKRRVHAPTDAGMLFEAEGGECMLSESRKILHSDGLR